MTTKEIQQLERDAMLDNFEVDLGDFTCSHCWQKIRIAKHSFKPQIRGMWCECASWVGPMEELPKTNRQWQKTINKELRRKEKHERKLKQV
jgi:hypothetical protein